MAIDNNLLLYNVAIVAIMKNERLYVKEWLDYHLLAGVSHFYIYDNESTDNMKEVLQPYINDGIVTYIFYPGKARQYEAYNDAIENYRFFCKYMAFVDTDEFIFPKNNKTILEVVDSVLEKNPNAGGLAFNTLVFGSNYQEKADYGKGVLARFTRRAPENWCPPIPELNNLPGGNAHVKSIVNPRKVHHFGSPHFAEYLDGYYAVNSDGAKVPMFYNSPVLVDKIVLHHYSVKSKEEYQIKINRGAADNKQNIYHYGIFNREDRNEVFDDSILKYRASRRVAMLENYSAKYKRVQNAMLQQLFPVFSKNVQSETFQNNMETFLACRKLSEYLRENLFDDAAGNFFEEFSLSAINKTLSTPMTSADFKLFLSELPSILTSKYPVVREIHRTCISGLEAVLEAYRTPNIKGWEEFVKYKYLMKILQLIDNDKLSS